MTATDLLACPTFLSLCACWERDRRCPLVMPDYLREQGLEECVPAAEWCVSEPDRPMYRNGEKCAGPYPLEDGGGWMWWVRARGLPPKTVYAAKSFPRDVFGSTNTPVLFSVAAPSSGRSYWTTTSPIRATSARINDALAAASNLSLRMKRRNRCH